MSLLDKATIITTPTAQSEGKLHSIKGGSVADFDVVRGSAATRVNAEGLIEDVATNIPRIDYTTGEGVILTEPQSTNLIPYSEDFSDASWSKVGSSVTSDVGISPNGTQNADLLKGSTSSSRHYILKGLASANVSANISFFAKAKELRYIQVACQATANQYANFDVQDGVVGAVGSDFSNAKIEDYGNGWYRCSVVSTNRYTSVWVSLISGLNSTWLESWAMPNNTDGLYIWGAQLEENYATSYIPTSGAIATRLADSVTGAGSTDLINSEEGVLYAEIAALANDGTARMINISDGTLDNRVEISLSNQDNFIRVVSIVNGIYNAAKLDISANVTDFNKIAFSYKENDFKAYLNGTNVFTDTSAIIFAANTLDTIDFSLPSTNSFDFFGKTKALAVWKEALSDEELTCLTTI